MRPGCGRRSGSVRAPTSPRESGLRVERGIVVDDRMVTSHPRVLAVGECAQHRGVVYGIVAPIHDQAAVAAATLAGAERRYEGSVPAATLKVMGVDVVSAGAAEGDRAVVAADGEQLPQARGARMAAPPVRCCVGDTRGAELLVDAVRSGREVGDPLGLLQRGEPGHGRRPARLGAGLQLQRRLQGRDRRGDPRSGARLDRGGGGRHAGRVGLRLLQAGGVGAPEARARRGCRGAHLPLPVPHARRASSSRPSAASASWTRSPRWRTPAARGATAAPASRGSHTSSRRCAATATGRSATPASSTTACTPTSSATAPSRSCPRIRGGVTSPEELRRIADVAERHEVPMVKITGGQRIDLLGVRKEQLPAIWEELGMPSGHAYAKAVRTVKTCVGHRLLPLRAGRRDRARDRARAAHGGPLHTAQGEVGGGGMSAQLLRGLRQGHRHRRRRGWLGGVRRRRRRIDGAQGRPARHRDATTRRRCGVALAFLQHYREQAEYLERTYAYLERVGIDAVRKAVLDPDESARAARALRDRQGGRRSRTPGASGATPVHPKQFAELDTEPAVAATRGGAVSGLRARGARGGHPRCSRGGA